MHHKEITHLFIQRFKEVMGRGPSLVRINISENIINADIKGVLTIPEQSLLKNSINNKVLIKVIRKQLMELVFRDFSAELQTITNIDDLELLNYTFVIDFENDRQVMVLVCNKVLSE